jgi:predicted permease
VILYVLVVWGLVTAVALLLEVILLAHHQQHALPVLHSPLVSEVQTLLIGVPLTEVKSLPVAGITGLCLLSGASLGWLCERYMGPVKRLYQRLQRTYPGWYQRWPAAQREVRLALVYSAGLGLLAAITGFVYPHLWAPALGLASGSAIGLLLLPVLRLRTLKLEDRPETAPQALIHQLAPRFSVHRSLFLGQLYLRLLLPCFCLFLLLILPLSLEMIHLSAWSAVILMSSLVSGLLGAWHQWRDSQLSIESFGPNLLQLGTLMLVASALLGFGVGSDNWVCLGLMGFLSGYVAGSY